MLIILKYLQVNVWEGGGAGPGSAQSRFEDFGEADESNQVQRRDEAVTPGSQWSAGTCWHTHTAMFSYS